MRIEEAGRRFLRHLEAERGCTPATILAYASDVRRLLAYLEGAGVEADTQAVSAAVARGFVSHLADRGSSPATIRRRVYCVSSLWKWLIANEEAASNPCAGLLLPRKRQRLPVVLTVTEARRLLAAAEGHPNPRMAFRDRAAISTLLFCGLRRSELLDLRVSDLDLRGRWLKVRRGKGFKGRLVPMVAEAVEALSDWLEFRPEAWHECLFTGTGGRPLGVNGIDRMFRRVARRAGVMREGVSLHTLRHSFATFLLQQGCDLVSIKEMLGHADLSTTAVYLHLDATHLQNAVEKHPLRQVASGRAA
jgi:site-specific recombinase XerD